MQGMAAWSRRAGLVLGSVALALSAGATPVAALPGVTFVADIGGRCLQGKAPPHATVRIILKGPHGALRDSDEAEAGAAGRWEGLCFGVAVRAHDRIVVKRGSNSRTVVVPNLTTVLDRAADTVRGVGPKGASVGIGVRRCPLADGINETCPLLRHRTRAIGPSGHYATDFTGAADLSGWDIVVVTLMEATGDRFRVIRRVPFFAVRLGAPFVTVIAAPGQAVTMELRTNGAQVIGVAHVVGTDVGALGVFQKDLEDKPVGLTDRIHGSFASDANLHVPADMTLVADDSADTVAGSCMPGARYHLSVFNVAIVDGVAAADGTFVEDLGAGADLSGVDMRIECYTAAGDTIEADQSVP